MGNAKESLSKVELSIDSLAIHVFGTIFYSVSMRTVSPQCAKNKS